MGLKQIDRIISGERGSRIQGMFAFFPGGLSQSFMSGYISFAKRASQLPIVFEVNVFMRQMCIIYS